MPVVVLRKQIARRAAQHRCSSTREHKFAVPNNVALSRVGGGTGWKVAAAYCVIGRNSAAKGGRNKVQIHSRYLVAPGHTHPLLTRTALLRRQPFWRQKGAAECQALSVSTGPLCAAVHTATHTARRNETLPFSLRLRYQARCNIWGDPATLSIAATAQQRTSNVVTTDSVAYNTVTSEPLPHKYNSASQSSVVFMRLVIPYSYSLSKLRATPEVENFRGILCHSLPPLPRGGNS